MKINRDQITGAVIVLLGVLVFVSISSYKVPFTLSYPGPRALPGLAAVGFVVCGAGIFIKGCMNREGEKPFLDRKGWLKLGISVAALIAYVALMYVIGFLIPTALFLYGISTYYAVGYNTKWWHRVIFAVATTAFLYLMYQVVFGYRLPTGILFG
ncbi:MAG: tripartite tricarboxylate transporter TctB family protein [Lachnospiraceae bacterium]|nr:tripartite tricarboxylate transporter TctB family protein [Lachnospiraceae bacterium]